MPRRRAAGIKLSRRRVGASARYQRAASPEQPFVGSSGLVDLEPPPDEDNEMLLAPPAMDAQIAKGDVVFCNYKGVLHPALVTRLVNNKIVTTKFVRDLVVYKAANPFKFKQSSCLRCTYEEKKRRRKAAEEAERHICEELLLALEAVDDLETTRATETVDDPEEFLKTRCDYIVRLRCASASPKKGAALELPPALASPLRLPPPAEARDDSDEDESDEAPFSPPLPPPPPPPPLPPHLRAEQCAYAERLLEAILSKRCARHLRAVHAGKAASWRRDSFWRGDRRALIVGCSLGDLESCPPTAEKARGEALRLTERLRGRRPVNRRQYAEEVLAPEAMMFAVAALSPEQRAVDDLEAELRRGSKRFHTH